MNGVSALATRRLEKYFRLFRLRSGGRFLAHQAAACLLLWVSCWSWKITILLNSPTYRNFMPFTKNVKHGLRQNFTLAHTHTHAFWIKRLLAMNYVCDQVKDKQLLQNWLLITTKIRNEPSGCETSQTFRKLHNRTQFQYTIIILHDRRQCTRSAIKNSSSFSIFRKKKECNHFETTFDIIWKLKCEFTILQN